MTSGSFQVWKRYHPTFPQPHLCYQHPTVFPRKKIPDWISLTLQRSVLASARSLFFCCCYFRFFLCYQYAIIYPTTKCYRFWTYVHCAACPSVQGVNNDHLHSIIQAQFLISINVEEKGARKILADVKFPEFLSRSKLSPNHISNILKTTKKSSKRPKY